MIATMTDVSNLNSKPDYCSSRDLVHTLADGMFRRALLFTIISIPTNVVGSACDQKYSFPYLISGDESEVLIQCSDSNFSLLYTLKRGKRRFKGGWQKECALSSRNISRDEVDIIQYKIAKGLMSSLKDMKCGVKNEEIIENQLAPLVLAELFRIPYGQLTDETNVTLYQRGIENFEMRIDLMRASLKCSISVRTPLERNINAVKNGLGNGDVLMIDVFKNIQCVETNVGKCSTEFAKSEITITYNGERKDAQSCSDNSYKVLSVMKSNGSGGGMRLYGSGVASALLTLFN